MPLSNDVVKHTISGLCGVVFGIAAEKGRVHHPTVIRGQMDFSTFTMMKMFLGASAAGMCYVILILPVCVLCNTNTTSVCAM